MAVFYTLPKAACPAGGEPRPAHHPPWQTPAGLGCLNCGPRGQFVVRNGRNLLKLKEAAWGDQQAWLSEAAFELLRRFVQVARCFLVVVVGLCLGGKVFLGKFKLLSATQLRRR